MRASIDQSASIQRVYRVFVPVALALIFGLTTVTSSFAADEYFTDAEIEQIREAQSIGRRIPVLLEIATVRLVRLGVVEGEEEVEAEDSNGNSLTRGIIRVLSPDTANELDQIAQEESEFDNDFSVFTRADLLRGYYQALEEAMDNIDDAYERGRGSVRRPLEDLLTFTEETIPALSEFSPENRDEENALEDALEIAGLARDGAGEALDVVPQTEER
jgi:hypothetical protein